MSKTIRFQGSFLALGGHTIKVEILKEGDAPFLDSLTFPADSPVKITWTEADKLQPVLSSSCTLSLESMTDRQFLDELYTEESGSVQLKVYRDGNLYWSGTLDPEQYEEPYSRARNYDVDITFNDFARLDRIKYDRHDDLPVKTLVEWIIGQSGVDYGSIVWNTSTLSSTGTNTAFTGSYVKSANWYDEEGEAMSLREVLDETLKVFSLRLKQKNGNIYIYDLNAIYSSTPTQVVWDGTDAMVAADRVYNDIEVTWSPYDNATLFESDFEVASNATAASTIQFPQNDTLTDDGAAAIHGQTGHSTESLGNTWWNSKVNLEGEQVYILKNREGFQLETYNSGKGATLGGSAKYFKIKPQYSGQDETGVLLRIGAFDLVTLLARWLNNLRTGIFGTVNPYTSAGHDALTFAKFYVPTLPDRSGYCLKLEVDALIDTRINPYESLSRKQQDRINVADHVYIPYNMKLESDDGNTYYWDTSAVMSSSEKEVSVLSPSAGWKQSGQQGRVFTASSYAAALHFTSNISAPVDAEANLGWTQNTVMMPRHSDSVSDSVQSMGRGEFIALPETGGWVTLSISDIIDSSDTRGNWEHYINQYLGWLAIKSVRVTIVDKYGHDLKTSDIVTRATINTSAKEELGVDTVLDVAGNVTNVAKGMLVDSTGTPLSGFRRAGATGTLAELMCNTIYSQYASRKLMLSGTAQLIPSHCILSEQNTEGKFELVSEEQDLRENTSRIAMVQFGADEYISTGEESDVVTYPISKYLAGTLLGNPAASVNEGETYITTVKASLGFELASVIVTMGGTDVTSSVYSNGVITIPSVTGAVVIAAISNGELGTTYGGFIPTDAAGGFRLSNEEMLYVIINRATN
jgi:hypothetical protein